MSPHIGCHCVKSVNNKMRQYEIIMCKFNLKKRLQEIVDPCLSLISSYPKSLKIVRR